MQDNSKDKGTHNPMDNTNSFIAEYANAPKDIVQVKIEKMDISETMDIDQETNSGWSVVGKKGSAKGKSQKKLPASRKSTMDKVKIVTQSPDRIVAQPAKNKMEVDSESDYEDIYDAPKKTDTDQQEAEEDENNDKKEVEFVKTQKEKKVVWEITTNGGKDWADYESDDEQELEAFANSKLSKGEKHEEKEQSENNITQMEVIHEDDEDDQLKKPEETNEGINGKSETKERSQSENPQGIGGKEEDTNKKDDEQSSLKKANSDKPNDMEEDSESSSLKKANTDIRSFSDIIKAGIKPKYLENTVRYRCQLRFNKAKAEIDHMKETLKTALDIAKSVDSSAQLVTLGRDAMNIKNEMEINKLDRESIKSYIDWRVDRNEVNQVKIKHSQNKVGIRITYSIDKLAFFNRWRAMRKPSKEQLRNYFAIRLDKVQNGTRAYQVGMFIGTSHSQNLERLQKEIEQATGIEGIEVSYQDIYQVGATEELREKAYQKADAYNRYSRDWFDVINTNSPKAVMVYVQNPNMMRAARDLLLAKYQKEVDGQWPRLPDGSLAKFVPLKGSKVSDEVTEQIKTRLRYHIELNDKFVNIPIDATEIDVKYKEMDNKSIRDILHEMVAEKISDDGVHAKEPLIRHVCDRWSPNPDVRKYSVAVLSPLAKEAEQKMQFLHELLETSFPAAASVLRRVFNTRKEEKYVPKTTKTKNEEDDWFKGDNEERYKRIKIEGLEIIQREDLPTARKVESTIAVDDLTSSASLKTIETSDKTPDTTVEVSDEIVHVAQKYSMRVEQVQRRLAQVKAKLKFVNEFKDKKEHLEEILRMKHKSFNHILISNPLYWSSKHIAEMILERYKEDLGNSPGEGNQ